MRIRKCKLPNAARDIAVEACGVDESSQAMIYLKSAFAGIAAVVLSFCLLFVGIMIYLWIAALKEGDMAIGWDPTSVVRPGPLLFILTVFVVGFLWEFRRASH